MVLDSTKYLNVLSICLDPCQCQVCSDVIYFQSSSIILDPCQSSLIIINHCQSQLMIIDGFHLLSTIVDIHQSSPMVVNDCQLILIFYFWKCLNHKTLKIRFVFLSLNIYQNSWGKNVLIYLNLDLKKENRFWFLTAKKYFVLLGCFLQCSKPSCLSVISPKTNFVFIYKSQFYTYFNKCDHIDLTSPTLFLETGIISYINGFLVKLNDPW